MIGKYNMQFNNEILKSLEENFKKRQNRLYYNQLTNQMHVGYMTWFLYWFLISTCISFQFYSFQFNLFFSFIVGIYLKLIIQLYRAMKQIRKDQIELFLDTI